MNETEKAYLAGLIDGEGNIFISNNIGLQVGISMSCKATIKYVAQLWSSRCEQKTIISRRRDMYRTRIFGSKAQDMLRQILPYMITKRQQAEWTLLLPIGPSGRGRNTYTQKQKELREMIACYIKEYNSGDMV